MYIYIYTQMYVNYIYIYMCVCVSVYKSHSQEFDIGTANLMRRSTKPSNFDSKRSTILTNEDGAKKKCMSSNWKLEQQPHSNIFQPLFLATNLLLRAVSSWILLWAVLVLLASDLLRSCDRMGSVKDFCGWPFPSHWDDLGRVVVFLHISFRNKV